MNGSTKILPTHRQRQAVVYLRQSTPKQVLKNCESAINQRALRGRLLELGWRKDQIVLIDEDQARSAKQVAGRDGFQRLVADVSLRKVGLIIGTEVARLSRNCADWHRLLELCALFDTLIADADGVYNPRDFNDRLLLGLKGTLSEAELHSLRLRLDAGRLSKAGRGELVQHLPTGLVRDASGVVRLDPDQSVQDRIRMVFAKFRELGSAQKVLRYMAKHGLKLPRRQTSGLYAGTVLWKEPNSAALLSLLKNPAYAGAFTYGRRIADPARQVPGRPATGKDPPAARPLAGLGQGRLPGVHYVGGTRTGPGHDRGEPAEDGGTSDTEASDPLWRGPADGPGALRALRPRHASALQGQSIPIHLPRTRVLITPSRTASTSAAARSTRPWCRSSSGCSSRPRSTHSKRVECQAGGAPAGAGASPGTGGPAAGIRGKPRRAAVRQRRPREPPDRATLETRWEAALVELEQSKARLAELKGRGTPPVAIPEALRAAFADVGRRLPELWERLPVEARKTLLRTLVTGVNLESRRERCGDDEDRVAWRPGQRDDRSGCRCRHVPRSRSENGAS